MDPTFYGSVNKETLEPSYGWYIFTETIKFLKQNTHNDRKIVGRGTIKMFVLESYGKQICR